MTDGPTYPPRLAMELIKAMPEAAENPATNLFGIEKNGPKKLYIPIATNDQSAIERRGERVKPSNKRATPPTMSGIAAWNRRSMLRSELRETRIIATNPAK